MECSQHNGRIDGYRLVYYPTMNSSNNETVLVNGSNKNTYTTVGLPPRINYTFKLAAFSSKYQDSYFGPESMVNAITSVPQGIVSHIYSNYDSLVLSSYMHS